MEPFLTDKKCCEVVGVVIDIRLKKMCNKAVHNYVHALECLLNSYRTWKMGNKAADASPES